MTRAIDGRAIAVILAGAFALACGGGDGDGPDAGPASATLGTGIDAFEPLAAGQDLFIVQGPQGGYHFFVSVSATGVVAGNPDDLSDDRNPTTTFRAFAGGQRVDLDAADFTQGLRPIPETGGVGMIGRLLILDIQSDDELAGATVRIEVTVRDTAGAAAGDERTVVGVPHPDNR